MTLSTRLRYRLANALMRLATTIRPAPARRLSPQAVRLSPLERARRRQRAAAEPRGPRALG